MNLTQYYFDPEITEEEKETLKKFTFQTEVNIGIYVSVSKNKTTSNSVVFGDAKIIFNIKNEVIKISNHLLRIIQFLVYKTDGKSASYFLSLSKTNNKIIQLDLKTSATSDYTLYTVIASNDNVIVFDNKKIKEENSKIIVESCHDLSDQYHDFIKLQNSYTPKLTTNIDKTSETIMNKVVKSNKIITIIENDEHHEINFTNCKNFIEISKYLKKNFGKGRFSHTVDLETESETIEYILD